MLEVLSKENASIALGYASIVAWLFAQSPQVLENYRNGSVEGLALPFLVSWLCGDVTNLIGCILTHQLPFQTYLATYFVGVDVVLMSQYVYYSLKHPVPTLPPFSESYPHAQAPDSRHIHSHSHTRRGLKRGRKHGGGGSRSKSHSAGGDDTLARSWMSEASNGYSPSSSRQNTNARPSRQHSRQHSFNDWNSSGSAMSTEPPSPTLPERGRTLTRPTRPTVPNLETISGSPASGSPVPGLHQVTFRGETQDDEEEEEEEHRRHRHRQTGSSSRSRPPTSRRPTSSMLFLSVGLLFTFSQWSGGQRPTEGEVVGVAWGVGPAQVGAPIPSSWTDLRHPSSFSSPFSSPTVPPRHRKRQIMSDVPLPASRDFSTAKPSADKPDWDDEEHDHYPKRDLERFVGRASAWLCTTLYLTSRLPQIWQNFRRRSVEGLSMLLFIMAFIGNSLYTLSILTNPLMGTPGYILECLPYLLGSGGTLCFDVTIVLQSVLYSEKRKAAQERARRRRGHHSIHAEEAAALLDETEEEEGTETEGDDSTTGARSRNTSIGPSRSRSSRRTLSRKSSQSTELGVRRKKSSSRSRTRPAVVSPQDALEDRPFNFDSPLGVYGDGGLSVEGDPHHRSPHSSRGPSTRASSTSSKSKLVDIREQGESAVTIRSD